MDPLQPALFSTDADDAPPVYRAEDFPFFFGARHLADRGFIAQDWVEILQPLDDRLRSLALKLAERSAAGEHILPAPDVMLRALTLERRKVRVLILGQDPYPTVGHAVGLAFAAHRNVRPLPRSLANIYRELSTDLSIEPAAHADLSSWHEQGVLLLNQSLSVTSGQAGSHKNLGWSLILQAVLSSLNALPEPPVAVLWGQNAQKMAVHVDRMPVIESAHPSPLSASRGFFGSRPFSRINALLEQAGRERIDWRVL